MPLNKKPNQTKQTIRIYSQDIGMEFGIVINGHL